MLKMFSSSVKWIFVLCCFHVAFSCLNKRADTLTFGGRLLCKKITTHQPVLSLHHNHHNCNRLHSVVIIIVITISNHSGDHHQNRYPEPECASFQVKWNWLWQYCVSAWTASCWTKTTTYDLMHASWGCHWCLPSWIQVFGYQSSPFWWCLSYLKYTSKMKCWHSPNLWSTNKTPFKTSSSPACWQNGKG